MKTYIGYRVDGFCTVEVHCDPLTQMPPRRRRLCGEHDYGFVAEIGGYFLPLRSRFAKNAAIGFDWGNHSFRASQFALSLLADVLGNQPIGLALCADFQREIVAKLLESFELSESDILDWYADWQQRVQEPAAEAEMAAV